MSTKQPVIIILNGASSAGKTLTGQALVKLLGTKCVLTGLDDLMERTQLFGSENGGVLAGILRSIRIIFFQLTDGRLQLFKKLHREMATSYRAGNDVIAETSLMDTRALFDAAKCFSSLNAFFIAMKPPLAVSEQWEATRNDRPLGQARKHYDLIHAHGIYDLVIDPSQMTPEECAAKILYYSERSKPNAFRKLLESVHE